MNISGNTFLVTGGGSGIGEALAQRWHDLGNTVIVAGRRKEALESAIEGRENMHAMTLDVSDPDDITRFAKELVAAFPKVNVLVNNAGIMRFEDPTTHQDLDGTEATITTNLLGPIRLTNALIDHLREVENGAIINVTSGLSYVPLPKAATYSATKAALHSYTESLRLLLDGKVTVIELDPPGVQTDITPGQSSNENYQPLDDFADEAIGLWQDNPDAPSIDVENVKMFKNARAEGRYDEVLAMLGSI